MFVCALRIELFLSSTHSLKEKRAVIRPIIEGLHNRFSVAAAEVAHQERWQRCVVGIAAVAGTPSHVEEVLDACERFVWSFPDVEVTSMERTWLEE